MKQFEDPLRMATAMGRCLRRKIGEVLLFRGFLSAFGAASFAAGALVLAIRILPGAASSLLSWGIAAAAFAVSVVYGAVFAVKHLPPLQKLLVWLDGAGGSDGVLTASLELNPGVWREKITLPATPKIRIGSRGGAAAAGLLFLTGTLLIPQSRIAPRERHPLDLTAETADLEPKIAVLEEESLLPAKELSELHAALQELKTGNDARNAARSYELLEALVRKTDLAGAAAGERIRNEVETLRNLALTLNTLSSLPPDQVPAEAAEQLGTLLEQFAQENPALAEMLADTGGTASKLDPEMMRRLAETMRDSSHKLEQKLAKLVEQKLLDSRCARPGWGDEKNGLHSSSGASCSEELASWLEQNAPGAEALQEVCLIPGKGQGQGDPGRGDAMLRYIGNTGEFSGKMKDLAVPGAGDPEQSVVMRRFAAAPNVDAEERRAATAGQLRGGEAEFEQREAPIYPEHRAAVKRYFKAKEP